MPPTPVPKKVDYHEPESGKPSAALVKRSIFHAENPENLFARMKDHLAKVFGLEKGTNFCYRVQGDDLFFSASPYDTLNYPKDHELAGQPRYDWADGAKPEIKIGTLKPEPKPNDLSDLPV